MEMVLKNVNSNRKFDVSFLVKLISSISWYMISHKKMTDKDGFGFGTIKHAKKRINE